MRTIRPIDTFYGGYRFRSRLEARWAVFFSRCGIDYRYELQGFQLKAGKYLPDFFVPIYNGFFEVKPLHSLPNKNFEFDLRLGDTRPIDDAFPHELQLAWDLFCSTQSSVVVAYGDPYDVIHDGTSVAASRDGLRATNIGFIDLFPADLFDAALAARAARFEFGESR